MAHATKNPTSIDELRALLEQQRAEAREDITRLQQEIDALRQQVRPTGRVHARSPKRAVSRATLLKGAAAGVAGLAAAELSGNLSATPAFAGTTTDTNFVATGGTGAITGVQVGGQSPTDYGYGDGGQFRGLSRGVVGYALDSSGNPNGGTGVAGSSGSGFGVQGYSNSGYGVYGYSNYSDGVYGQSAFGTGVQGQSGSYGGWFDGGLAPIYLKPAGAAGAPTTGNHSQGEIMIDGTGVPYVCSAGNGTTLGSWQAIGNLRSFPNPRRVYQNTGVVEGSNYPNIDATTRLNSTPSGVPAGAAAAYCAVQATPTSANARLALGPNDNTFNGGIANFTAPVQGALNLLYQLVPLSTDGKFQFTSYLTGAVYVDVWGFML